MKNILITTLFLLFIISCKKDEISASIVSAQESNSIQSQDAYLNTVKRYLIDSISAADYRNIDFNKVIATKFDSGRIFLLRLQFKKLDNEFILLKTDASGRWSKGMILNIKYAKGVQQSELVKKPHSFNGNIIISSLNRKSSTNYKIYNGLKNNSDSIKNFVLPSGNTLPDVIVTAYIPPSGSISYADWYNLLDLYTPSELGIYNYGGGGGGNSFYGYYSAVDPYAYGHAGGGSTTANPKEVEYEDVESLEAISITDYMKCFDNISDNGATCSIEIFTDLPVNGEPNNFFNWETGSPGHTFLQIKKSNGSETVQQNIGFYPDQGWKTMLTPAPVAGKFVDNQGHEYNGSFKMVITAVQLHTIITEIEYLANSVRYDIDDFNCTDFALHIFNSVRISNELSIPKYDIPGGMAPNGTSTPQGLYQELQALKEEGGSEADNITFPGVAGWVGGSHGACN